MATGTGGSRRFAVLMVAAILCVAANAATGASAATHGAAAFPDHVSAPYFETYSGTDLSALWSHSHAKYLTLAFLETPTAGSCEIDWNGDPTTPVAESTYGADIATIRAGGGDVIPSFGGYSADHTGRELADSCPSVVAIAMAIEKVVTTYDARRLDFDVEDRSLRNAAAIDRRNEALEMVAAWATQNNRNLQFVYTLPTNMDGLDTQGVKLLRDATKRHAPVTEINVMTFDYYDNAPHEMADDTKTAAKAVIAQLAGLYPGVGDAQLYGRLGVTEMIGIDDFGAAETLSVADARAVVRWANENRLSAISFWALQRDNGGCPGTKGSDHCSGIAQKRWQFTRSFAAFDN